MYLSTICLKLFLFIYFISDSYCDEKCGIPNKENDRIVNGKDVTIPRKYPWYATMVLADNPRQLVCGGSLIHPRHILSAAHCYKPFFKQIEDGKIKAEDIYLIKLGVYNICIEESEVQIYTTIKVYIPEQYYEDLLYYDIALMAIDAVVTDYMPICLPTARYESNNRTGLMSTIIGLGKESSNAWRLPCILKEAMVPIQSDTACKNMMEQEKSRYGKNIFCAGYQDGSTDTCQGDSGGPLQIFTENNENWMLLGVTSFGFSCAKQDTFGVYTDVSHYIDWIHDKIDDDENKNYVFVIPKKKNNFKSKSKPLAHKKRFRNVGSNHWLNRILLNL